MPPQPQRVEPQGRAAGYCGRTLKDRRAVIRSLRDQLRGRFNVAAAEVNSSEKWQRATVGEDRAYVEGLLRQVTIWLRMTGTIELIRLDEEDL